jgi:hypothetical protein
MKNKIALPPFHITETTRFTVEADHELTETLRRYQVFYREAYGANVKEADLLREMARRFMAEDKEFQSVGQKRRRSTKKPAPAPSAERRAQP